MIWLSIALIATLATTPLPLQPPTTLPPVIPWATFSEAAKDGVGSRIGQCLGGREVLVGTLRHQEDEHTFLFDPVSQRLMWIYQPGGGEPTWVGTGQVADPPRHDIIPPLQWVSIGAAEARWPRGPCQFLMEAGA